MSRVLKEALKSKDSELVNNIMEAKYSPDSSPLLVLMVSYKEVPVITNSLLEGNYRSISRLRKYAPVMADELKSEIEIYGSLLMTTIEHLSSSLKSFKTKSYLKVNEISYKQLMTKVKQSDGARVDKAKTLVTRYMGLNSQGDLLFRTTSGTTAGKYWYQTVRLLDLQDALDLFKDEDVTDREIVSLAVEGDIAIYCNDPSFKYWGWQYMATKDGYSIQDETRAPEIRNVGLKGALCKHLYNVLMVMPFHTNTIVKDLRKRHFQPIARSKDVTPKLPDDVGVPQLPSKSE